MDLSKQKSNFENQQINFIGRLEQDATIFFIIEEKHKTRLVFVYCIKMESQKIIILLEQTDDEELKFQTKKWYIINDQNNGSYGKGDQNDSTIKFSKETVKSFLVDYSDAYILVTGDITVVGGDGNTKVAFKNCHQFIRAVNHMNDEHVDSSENLDLITNMYNLIEYSDNYSDSTASLYHCKRQEPNLDAAGDVADLDPDDSSSFKYKSNLLGESKGMNMGENPDHRPAHRLWKNFQTAVPLKYISNFFRSLELLFINTKLYVELNWLNLVLPNFKSKKINYMFQL